MAEIINRITLVAQQVLGTAGYPGIFLVVFAENFLGPIPMPPILPLSGMMAARGTLNFFGVWAAAVAGALAGALALYAVGAWADERFIRGLIRRYGKWMRLTEASLDRALGMFKQYGAPVIIVGRLFPVARNAVSLTAGMSRLPIPQFLLYTALISTPSIGIWVYGGYALGENWRDVLRLISQYERILIPVIVIGVTLIVVFTARRFMGKRAA